MTIKEFFADYSEEYADVFILDSEDDGNAVISGGENIIGG